MQTERLSQIESIGFNPYEKEFGNMVAEDMRNSYDECEQIALVAIEIEKHITVRARAEGRNNSESYFAALL